MKCGKKGLRQELESVWTSQVNNILRKEWGFTKEGCKGKHRRAWRRKKLPFGYNENSKRHCGMVKEGSGRKRWRARIIRDCTEPSEDLEADY